MMLNTTCHKCGTIAKSGKSSCCGRGGSWFENCGGAGNAKVEHTWHEGILACKVWPEFKTVIDRQSNAAQQLNSSDGVGVVITNFNAVATADSSIIPMKNIKTAEEATRTRDWISLGMQAMYARCIPPPIDI